MKAIKFSKRQYPVLHNCSSNIFGRSSFYGNANHVFREIVRQNENLFCAACLCSGNSSQDICCHWIGSQRWLSAEGLFFSFQRYFVLDTGCSSHFFAQRLFSYLATKTSVLPCPRSFRKQNGLRWVLNCEVVPKLSLWVPAVLQVVFVLYCFLPHATS